MKNAILIVILIILLLLSSIGCIETTNIKYRSTEELTPKMKQGKMSFNITLITDESTETARLWLPYPVSNDHQIVENMIIGGNYDNNSILREQENGIMILYAEWINPQEIPQITLSFDITRTEIIKKNFPLEEGSIPSEIQEYLLPTSLGPITGIVEENADRITEGKTTILGKATAIYDYLVERGERDANLSFCGDGDVCKLLLDLKGKCVDFSSVFVALSRSAGVPAREILGTRIAKNGDITGAYHCHAEFYLPNYDWVPVDPSDVAKLMLNENLKIDDPQVIEARDYYFGAQTETYIDLSTGRDIILNPMQDSNTLNYFMYPYAEVDGEPLDYISQEYLKYTVMFIET